MCVSPFASTQVHTPHASVPMKARECWEPNLAPLEDQPHYCLYDSPVLTSFKDQTKASVQLRSLTPQSLSRVLAIPYRPASPALGRAGWSCPSQQLSSAPASTSQTAQPSPSLIQLLCQFNVCASLSLRPAPHNCGNVC